MPLFLNEAMEMSPLASFIFTVCSFLIAIVLIDCHQEISRSVDEFRNAAWSYSLRLAFTRVRLQNAENELQHLRSTGSRDRVKCYYIVQERIAIKEYVEDEAREPLNRLCLAERYGRFWWTGVVSLPALPSGEKVIGAEEDSDDDGYWSS